MKKNDKIVSLNDYGESMKATEDIVKAIVLCTDQHKAEVEKLLDMYGDVLLFNIQNNLDEHNYGCILNNIFEFCNNDWAVDALLDAYKEKRLKACDSLQALAQYGISTDEAAEEACKSLRESA